MPESRIRLGPALAAAGRRRTWRLRLLHGLGIALLTVVVLSTLGAFTTAQLQSERRTAITPVLGAESDGSGGRLVTVDPALESHRRWNGHDVKRAFYAGGGDVAIPGVPRVPREKEYFASPALASLIERDPVVAAQFTGREQAGLLGPDALVDPTELRAVVGMNLNPLLASEVTGFGAEGVSEAQDLNLFVALLVVTVAWLPTLGLLVMASRLNGRAHQRTARALRLVGLSRAQVRLVEAVTAARVAVPAVLVGALAFVAMTRWERIPGTAIGFFAEDALLPLGVLTATGVGVIALACAVSAFSVALSGDQPSRRVPVPGRSARVGGVALAAGSITLLAMPILRELLGTPANFLLWVACAAVAGGLGLCGPLLVSRVANHAAARSWRPSPMVGLRMAGGGGSSSVRLASVLSVLVVLLLGARSFLFILEGGSDREWAQRISAQERVPASATDLRGDLTLEAVRRAVGPSVPTLQVRESEAAGRSVQVVSGTCGDLRDLSGEALEDCSSSRPTWIEANGSLPDRPTGALEVDGRRVELPAPSARLTIGNFPGELAGALFVPSSDGTTGGSTDGSTFLLLPTGEDASRTLAAVSSLDPVVQLDLGGADRGNPDVQQYPTQAAWVVLAAIVALLIGAVALLVGATGEVADRAVRYRGLELVGTPRRQVLAVHAWAVVSPLAGLLAVATAVGTLVCWSMRVLDDRAAIPTSLAASFLLGGLAVAALIGALTAPVRPEAESRSRG